MSKHTLASLVASLLVLGSTSMALAQEKPQKGVITLDVVNIIGRVQKPIASVDVNRIDPKLTLQELRQPFLDRVEAAVFKAPF